MLQEGTWQPGRIICKVMQTYMQDEKGAAISPCDFYSVNIDAEMHTENRHTCTRIFFCLKTVFLNF